METKIHPLLIKSTLNKEYLSNLSFSHFLCSSVTFSLSVLSNTCKKYKLSKKFINFLKKNKYNFFEMGKLFILFLISFLLLITKSSVYGENENNNKLPIITFEEGYSHLFGDDNLMVLRDGKSVHLLLDKRTGSGFMSHDIYQHGLFSASIKLPSDYTAGVVVAFYMSNGDMYEKNHDEIDFEFLGNIRGKEWRIQTNVYGNGSTTIGREERCTLWFDPSEEFHQYSILWTEDQIIFYVDDVSIREINRTKAMKRDFPTKPMSLYATIWDASDWATNGGKYKVDYRYAPYVAQFSNLVLHGCAVDPVERTSKCDDNASANGLVPRGITPLQRVKMAHFRKNHLTYSYCYDQTRYKVPPSECVLNSHEAERLKSFDPVTFGGGKRRRGRRHSRTMARDKKASI